MGEHKHNPTATAAKNGELQPKQRICGSKADAYKMVHDVLCKKTALGVIEREIRRAHNGSLY